jgi:hypothetical protein
VLNLIATILTGRLKAQAKQGMNIGILAAIAGFLAIVGLAYALAALRTWLVTRFDSITADLILCGAFLIVAMGFALAAWIVGRRPPPVDQSAALTGALAPLLLGILAEWAKPRGQTPAARPTPAAAVQTPSEQAEPTAAHVAASAAARSGGEIGGALLALVPVLVAGILLGRKGRG